ncbi:Inner membrane protein YejM [Vibrio stylophorae]|uniref:Inner membrane protein YejM n=1 Tax=Vibrio stylophorae TaxID=659351 RepID=A0ABM8ZRZ5_9VIBR|nr:DUF3413 domain-containing protein [Vibrio stylophorae]CAH0533070.1 Inner membrane protein YejM [Vibrio stylophorae]
MVNGHTYREKVSQLIGWGHWFAFFNIIAAMLLGTRYITESEWPATLLGQFYLGLSWIGHFSFLVFALYLLVLFPLTFLLPSQRALRLFAVLFSTVGMTLLLLDTQAYEQHQLHLSPLVWELLLSGEKSDSNATWQYLFTVMPIFFLLELALAEWTWRKQRKLARKNIGGTLAMVFGLCFISSHLIHIWADANLYRPITVQKSNFPLSYPMTAKSFMERHGLLDRASYAKKRAEQGELENHLINYPLEAVTFRDQGSEQNLLIIMVNGLRSDMLNHETMPNTTAFAAQNLNFTKHHSASNDTMVGLFGLFYGLPGNYVDSVRQDGAKPLLVDTLTKRQYHFGLFSGNQFAEPLYYQAIFNRPEVLAQTATAYDDAKATQAWIAWEKTQSSPWFSYLELTSVLDYENKPAANTPFSQTDAAQAKVQNHPEATLLNHYRAAAYRADGYIAQVLAQLRASNQLENTLVIITSDHGLEFNETGTNSWGANSNYSRYQIQVPLVMHLPGHAPLVVERPTSHLDIVPTLMEELLHIATPAKVYSSGLNLLDSDNARRWLIAGDSRDVVVIEPHRTTVVDKFGNHNLFDAEYQPINDKAPLSVLSQVMAELKRFYRQPSDS